MKTPSDDARISVTRGGHLESTHRIHARVRIADRTVLASGSADRLVVMRSCAKPLQALPLVEGGVLEAFGLGEEALALACASHNSEAVHVEATRRMLAGIGCSEDQLECGGHPPLDRRTHESRLQAGETFGAVDSNCSGKHAGFLALARHHGWPTEGYRLPEHPVQRRMLATVADWTGVDAAEIATATDGCGVVCFGVSLEAMTGAFLRFAQASQEPESPAARVSEAMRRHTYLVGGRGRLCTELPEATQGRVLAKIGAEGVYVAWGTVQDRPFAAGLKVEDGGRRAVECALVGVLEASGILQTDELERLARFRRPRQTNTRGEEVGELSFAARAGV